MRPKKHETKDLFALSGSMSPRMVCYALNAYRNHEGVGPWDID